MFDPPLPWEEVGRIAVKIGTAALLIIAWRRHRARNRAALVEDKFTLQEARTPSGSSKGPRPFYYVLAHVALRELAMSDPGRFLEAVSGDGASLFLQQIWDRVRADVAPDKEIPTELIRCNVDNLAGGRHLAVINMPTPGRITEAFFVAALVDQPAKHLGFLTRRPTCRYFTLELGESDEGEPETIFCEWLRDKGGVSHHNYGPIQSGGRDGFVYAIRSMIED